MTPQNLGDAHSDRPGLYRLAFAAQRVGMPPATFEEACTAGQIPIQIIRISPRLAFVRAAELSAFLKGNQND
jgi:hypothetical protein